MKDLLKQLISNKAYIEFLKFIIKDIILTLLYTMGCILIVWLIYEGFKL